MDMKSPPRIEAAEHVLPAPDFDATVTFFLERLGFRMDAIFPADDPATALVSGHGLRLRLERNGSGAPGMLRLLARDPASPAASRSARRPTAFDTAPPASTNRNRNSPAWITVSPLVAPETRAAFAPARPPVAAPMPVSPAKLAHALSECGADLELLEVALPAGLDA